MTRRLTFCALTILLIPSLSHGQTICPKTELFRFGSYYIYSTVECTENNGACVETPASPRYGFPTQVDTGCKHENGMCRCHDGVTLPPPLILEILTLTAFQQEYDKRQSAKGSAPQDEAENADAAIKSSASSFGDCVYELSDTSGRWEIVVHNLLAKVELGPTVLNFMCLYGTYHFEGQKIHVSVAIECPEVPEGIEARHGRIVLDTDNGSLAMLLQVQVKIGDTLRYLDFDQVALIPN